MRFTCSIRLRPGVPGGFRVMVGRLEGVVVVIAEEKETRKVMTKKRRERERDLEAVL